MKADKNLWVLICVCVINSLGFGIIVPLIYSYGKTFGINQQTVGYLTASFSVAQFFATPLLGAISDKWGRKPVLAISLAGTCLSFLLFATAHSIVMLFAARILDGITGGNISVAQAMISDTATPKDRAKKFGYLSSAFGFGFICGPALGGLLSKFGMQFPFYFAAGIALLGTLGTVFLLKETYTKDKRAKGAKSNFTFVSLATVIKKPVIGTAVLTGFFLTMAQFTMIIGFQTFSVDVLKLSPTGIGLFYAGFAVMGIIMQMCVSLFTKIFPSKSVILLLSTMLCMAAMFAAGFTKTFFFFAACLFIYGLFNGLRNPMLNAIIADHNDPRKQGEILGVNQSYASIGQTLGPVGAGLISAISIHSVFFLASFYILIGFLLTFRLKSKEQTKPHSVTYFNFNQILSVTMILFAIIDVLGTIPVIIELRSRVGHIQSERASIAALVLMVGFLFAGEAILKVIGLDIASFAIAGSLVIFIIAMEMIMGINLFKEEMPTTVSIVPIAFPLIAGAGTMTTLLSLKSQYQTQNIVVGIVLNTIVVYLVLKNVQWLEKLLGPTGVNILRKAFGVILLAIAIKLFRSNTHL